jgi:hypothetical protein
MEMSGVANHSHTFKKMLHCVSTYATSFDVILVTGKVQKCGRERVTRRTSTYRTELSLLLVMAVVPHWGTVKFHFIPRSFWYKLANFLLYFAKYLF